MYGNQGPGSSRDHLPNMTPATRMPAKIKTFGHLRPPQNKQGCGEDNGRTAPRFLVPPIASQKSTCSAPQATKPFLLNAFWKTHQAAAATKPQADRPRGAAPGPSDAAPSAQPHPHDPRKQPNNPAAAGSGECVRKGKVAETVGFEPTEGFPPRSVSNRVLSASQPRLRRASFKGRAGRGQGGIALCGPILRAASGRCGTALLQKSAGAAPSLLR